VGFVLVSAWSEYRATTKLPVQSSYLATLDQGTDANLPPEGVVTNAYFVASRFSLALQHQADTSSEVARVESKKVSFYRLKDGTIFTGDTTGDEPSGWGIISQPNGTRLEGDWKHGNPYHLTGIAFFPDGTVEKGTWDYVNEVGRGTITWRDGRVYTGPWKNVPQLADMPEGIGTMNWPDGRTYVGPFFNGQPHGQGKLTFADGRILEGLWQKGNFMVARQSQ
jgi:hypothetical protein